MGSLAQFVHEEEFRKRHSRGLRKGDRVIVGISKSLMRHKRYFSHTTWDGRYAVFSSGMTEWSSGGRIEEWPECESDE